MRFERPHPMSTEKIKLPERMSLRESNPGNRVAYLYGDNVRILGPMNPDMAAELVHRYNSQPALLAACQAALPWIKDDSQIESLQESRGCQKIKDQLRAALRLAGKEI